MMMMMMMVLFCGRAQCPARLNVEGGKRGGRVLPPPLLVLPNYLQTLYISRLIHQIERRSVRWSVRFVELWRLCGGQRILFLVPLFEKVKMLWAIKILSLKINYSRLICAISL